MRYLKRDVGLTLASVLRVVECLTTGGNKEVIPQVDQRG